jgi:hypothetical protein
MQACALTALAKPIAERLKFFESLIQDFCSGSKHPLPKAGDLEKIPGRLKKLHDDPANVQILQDSGWTVVLQSLQQCIKVSMPIYNLRVMIAAEMPWMDEHVLLDRFGAMSYAYVHQIGCAKRCDLFVCLGCNIHRVVVP